MLRYILPVSIQLKFLIANISHGSYHAISIAQTQKYIHTFEEKINLVTH